MHRTRTPLVKWLWAIFLVSTDKRGLSALALSRKIDIGLTCAWTMLHKIRKAMETRGAGYQLAGLIQVDDAFFKGGVNKGGDKRGRGTNKVPVIVMAAVKDEAITFAKMEVVEDVESDAIKSVLGVHVAPGQTVRSDGFPAYNVVKDIGLIHDKQIVYPSTVIEVEHSLTGNRVARTLERLSAVGQCPAIIRTDTLCIAAYGYLMATRLKGGGSQKNSSGLPTLSFPENYQPRGSRATITTCVGLDLDVAVAHCQGQRATPITMPVFGQGRSLTQYFMTP